LKARWTEQRIGQLAQAEPGKKATESRALDPKLGGGTAGGIAVRTERRRKTCRCVELGSLSHAEPLVQGLALPVGATRARFNIDAAPTRPAVTITTG